MKSLCDRCAAVVSKREPDAPSGHAVQASTFGDRFPDLQYFLEHLRKNGPEAGTGCLTLFFEAGVYKVCLNDRPEKRSSFVSHTSLGEAFRIADLQLRTGRVKWRQKGYKPQIPRPLF